MRSRGERCWAALCGALLAACAASDRASETLDPVTRGPDVVAPTVEEEPAPERSGLPLARPRGVGLAKSRTLFDPIITQNPARLARYPALAQRIDRARENHITPLDFAAARNDVESVRALLAAGADTEAYDTNFPRRPKKWRVHFWRALHFAAAHDATDVIPILLDAGAEIDATDSQRETPLLVAVRHGSVDAARLLIEAGARIDSTSRYPAHPHRRPLQVAAVTNNVELVSMLIAAGARLGARDKLGRTALDDAIAEGAEAAARVLVEAGAKPTERASEGE